MVILNKKNGTLTIFLAAILFVSFYQVPVVDADFFSRSESVG
jgi:hypothetical protein